MATRNAVPTKKLKTGQKVKVPSFGWATIDVDGGVEFHHNRESARDYAAYFIGGKPYVTVRLNPITGVVSK